jgi:transcriptional regulator with XRE-family HTH domain
MYIEKAKIDFGKWLCEEREAKGLRRSKLAAALGYRNINKGCRRIMAWEKGDSEPDTSQCEVLQSFLGIPQAIWETKVAERERVKEKGKDYIGADWSIRKQTESHLATYTGLLLKNEERIATAASWRHIHLHGLKLGLLYIGGSTCIHLGSLLGAWKERKFHGDTEKGEFWLLGGFCSPLSGMHSVRGFYRSTGETKTLKYLFKSAPSIIGPLVSIFRKGSMGSSGWSLPQLLAQLKVPVAPAEIHYEGELIGHYDFHKAELKLEDDNIRFPLRLEDTHRPETPDIHSEEKWGPPTHKGRVVIGNLLTGSFGAWEGEQWTVSTEEGRWSLCPGHAVRPNGMPAIRWTADIPPLVQCWLVRHLSGQNSP